MNLSPASSSGKLCWNTNSSLNLFTTRTSLPRKRTRWYLVNAKAWNCAPISSSPLCGSSELIKNFKSPRFFLPGTFTAEISPNTIPKSINQPIVGCATLEVNLTQL
ncbi:hypothetical protein WICPIJ_008730 [Wickerhamomyces pijperi]|uniref:Uncharacterized protein n=1 Tax=Wickerhamomyces pijperi TaxID=599730 RepID=A0A9P8PWZ2_WICPI|nr:hypothetical protein WICPIJ_008730 [Wickerhamomyces pijperi]